MRIGSGKIDQSIFFVALDSLGARKTGLSAFTVQRSRNGGALTAYTTPTIVELSAGSAPGCYALLIDEDTTIAAGSDSEEYMVHITCSGMLPVTRVLELFRREVTSGRTAAIDASGRIDLGAWLGSAPNALVGGKVDSWPAVIRSGAVQAGGNTITSIHLDSGASATTDIYVGMLVVLYAGTGAGQASNIIAYDGNAKLATIAPIATPADGTTQFAVVALPGLVAAASTDVKNQVVAALTTDTYDQIGQIAPPAVASFLTMMNFLYKLARNRLTNDGTQTKVYADNNTTVDHKAAVSETGGVVTRDKFGVGP